MSFIDGLRHRLYVLRRGESYGLEVEAELRLHLELERLALASGSRERLDAETRARQNVGNTTYYREEVRAMTPMSWLESIRQDTAYAWRGMRRAPAFALTVVVMIGLGLGVNAAMFSLLDHLLLQPPAGVTAPREVRRLFVELRRAKEPSGRMAIESFRYPEIRAVVAAQDSAVTLAAFSPSDSVMLIESSRRMPARRSLVTSGFFQVLDLRPQLGRLFLPEEQRIETPAYVAIVSDELWRRGFDASPSVLGRQVRIGRRKFTIVGVAPRDFAGIDLDRAEIWVPANTFESTGGWSMPGPWYESFQHTFHLITRTRGIGQEQRLLDLATTAYRSVHIRGFAHDSTARVLSGSILQAVGPMKRQQELTLATRVGAVSLIALVIAAANVANLLLLRAARRKREIALRRALGISQSRLFRQIAIESSLLVLLGGGVALLFAIWAGEALRRLVLPRIHWADGAVDARTILAVAIASLAVGLVTGLAPAFHGSRLQLADSLKAGAQEGAYRGSRLRSVLLGTQTMLCVVLLAGAGLFVRSLNNARSVDTGYDVERVAMFRPEFDDDLRHDAELREALPRVAQRVATMRGVQRVAYASFGPMAGYRFESVFLDGREDLPKFATDFGPSQNSVSPGFFETTGLSVRMGRDFTPLDDAAAPRVVVVGEAMARAYWPGKTALGQCLRLGKRDNACTTVVGVVEDGHRMQIMEQPVLQYYTPVAQDGAPTELIVHTAGGMSAAMAHEIDEILRKAIPSMEYSYTRRLADALAPQVRSWKLGATLFTALAALAVVVAAVGIYSVVAYAASQRVHEVGVRIALGARGGNIVDLVVRDGMRAVLVGTTAGIIVALALGRLVASFLFGITPYDPAVLAGAAAVPCAFGILASLIPAIRASRVSPLVALRAD